MLGVLLDMEPVNSADNTHQGHDIGKDLTQGINSPEGQLPVHKLHGGIGAGFHEIHKAKGQARHANQENFAQRPSLDKGQNQSSENQDQRGMDPDTTYHNNPPGS